MCQLAADGIFLPNNFDCIVRGNVCYNNERYQLLLTGLTKDNR